MAISMIKKGKVIKQLTLLIATVMLLGSCSQKKEVVILETPFGEMTAILYDETPIHKKNFLKLAKRGDYDSIIFHRIIEDFMIQTGDLATGPLGEPVKHFLEAEFNADRFFHEKGALAAARIGDDRNPTKKSSGSQFYIVDGETFDDEGLKERALRREYLRLDGYMQRMLKSKRFPEFTRTWQYIIDKANEDTTYNYAKARFDFVMNRKAEIEEKYGPQVDPGYNDTQREVYASIGGAPHLDAEYTVFGKVVAGLEVIDKIAAQPRDLKDKPLKDILLTVRIEKMSAEEYHSKYDQFIRK